MESPSLHLEDAPRLCDASGASSSALSMSRLRAGYAAQGIFHCMHKGLQSFQCAEGQRHAALVAQREPGGKAMGLHPFRRLAGKMIGRCTVFQPDSLDLTQGERLPQAGACRL